MIYADHAATTQLDPEAFEAMKPFLQEAFGNASQPYSLARKPKKAIQEARETIASCIGASAEEVIFTSGGTESDNWVIKEAAVRNKYRRATITSAFEHHAILHACQAIERQGYPVAYMRPDNEGIVSANTLEDFITDNTFLVSVMYANNEIGSIQPIHELCKVAHEYGALFHTDAVQAVGHVPIDVGELGVDMLSASAHKFNGPKGIGFLYIKNSVEMLPFIDGGAQENGKRAGTENVASIVGMAVALKKNCMNMAENRRHLLGLEEQLLRGLQQTGLDFIRNGFGEHIPGNVNLSFRNADGERLLHRLDLMGIYVSTGSACDSKNTQVSHVLKAIRVPDEYATGTIRISLGAENTEEQIDTIVRALNRILTEK